MRFHIYEIYSILYTYTRYTSKVCCIHVYTLNTHTIYTHNSIPRTYLYSKLVNLLAQLARSLLGHADLLGQSSDVLLDVGDLYVCI